MQRQVSLERNMEVTANMGTSMKVEANTEMSIRAEESMEIIEARTRIPSISI